MQLDLYHQTVPVPRAVRFPVELRLPAGFCVEDVSTWPQVDGALEYVAGRLLYMPPSGDVQQDVALAVAGVLDRWLDTHIEFAAGANEAGMLLDGEVRAADAAVWRRSVEGHTGQLRRTAPILAIEIAGQDQSEADLREKATWYFAHGVKLVWLILPDSRAVLILSPHSESRHCAGACLPANPELPGLEPEVARFFRRLQ